MIYNGVSSEPEPNHKCQWCGKMYYACNSCIKGKRAVFWKEWCCSEDCFAHYVQKLESNKNLNLAGTMIDEYAKENNITAVDNAEITNKVADADINVAEKVADKVVDKVVDNSSVDNSQSNNNDTTSNSQEIHTGYFSSRKKIRGKH